MENVYSIQKIHLNSMNCSIDKPGFGRYNISSVDRRL